ncbi:hypothetical protein BD779DRAFT_1466949 [Infundibulicybe gibba]|nr:hypothetical protein BD779DRAFT_1466949 [Infundibulicybe gibba]
MPPRPSALKLKQNRPSSAIYLGNNPALSQSHSSNSSYGNTNSTPPNLPDLPEPPSPSASSSSHGSGLPSPPRPTRRGAETFVGPELIEGGEDDDVDESGNEDGEDNTARLDRKISLQSSSENMLALQRVKRLTQRNRTTLDKLSSLSSSRLSTPSPSHASRSTARSPIHHPPIHPHRRHPTHPHLDYLKRAGRPRHHPTRVSQAPKPNVNPRLVTTKAHIACRDFTPRLGMEQEDDGASTRKRDPRARGALPREFFRGDDGERVNFGRACTKPRPSRSLALQVDINLAVQQVSAGRWVSEDLSSGGMIDRTISSGSGTSSVSFDLDPERPSPSSPSTGPKERRQSLRGGSVESVLGAGRTLVGQGLRAAGLGWRGDDTSRGGGARIDLGLGEAKSEDVFKVPNRRERRVEWNDGDVRGARDIDADRRRAATSMADYRYADRDPSDDEPMTAPPTALRSYRSAFPLRDSREGDGTFARETERERAGSALSRTESTSSRRPESLGMFETHLARAGLAGGQLSKNAQIIAHNAERLNGILKQGVSDELVRGVTGFLLGIGKVLRDVGGDIGHIRSASGSAAVLTEDVRVRGSPSPDAAASGRRSADSKQSWEPTREREGGRDEALRKLTGRSEGNLDMPRPSSTLRERNRETHYETPPQPQEPLPSKATPKNPVASMRRLFTPREQREQQMQLNGRGLVPSDSQDTIHGYEPSPSPAPRNQGGQNTTLDRSRTLPPLRMPKPLPTLPSESTLRRNQTLSETPPTNTNRDRNKISVGSVTTVRGSIPPFPTISTPNATTALTTHTVSNSPVVSASSLSRTDSDKSARSMVTFSRPSTVSSVSALSGLQQQHLDYERSRTTSSASSAANPDPSPAVKTKTSIRTPVTPMSGSETERDMRRKTLGARGMRMSLDNAPVESRTVNAADRGATSKVLPQLGSGSRRERRRTVTDIWPRD